MTNNLSAGARVGSVDALRGFAVMGIMLLHCIEHFNLYIFPEPACGLLKFTDAAIWQTMFFTFGGKAYAIFALLFGFSFFIQDNNQRLKGKDFRGRFAWRLVLLFLFGNLNAMFFTGEVLVLFSIVGFTLIPVARLKDKTVLIIAVILMLQPLEWYNFFASVFNPEFVKPLDISHKYFDITAVAQQGKSFFALVKANLWEGQIASLTWAWENGRFFQSAGLFMLGMLAGRKGIFKYTEDNKTLWIKLAGIFTVCFFVFQGLLSLAGKFIENPYALSSMDLILRSLANFSFMVMLCCSFLLLYYKTDFGANAFKKLEVYGKMSLSNYIGQSVMGSFIFYGWGLGMYQYLGITYSLITGIALFFLQYAFSRYWMNRHRHGPLEFVWKKLTWIGSK